MAEDKKKEKKKELLRRLRAWLIERSGGGTVGTQEKQIKELFPDDKDNKNKKNNG